MTSANPLLKRGAPSYFIVRWTIADICAYLYILKRIGLFEVCYRTDLELRADMYKQCDPLSVPIFIYLGFFFSL